MNVAPVQSSRYSVLVPDARGASNVFVQELTVIERPPVCGETDVPEGLRNVLAVSAGYHHNLAVLEDGTVRAWGTNSYGQLDVPADLRDVVAVAAGRGQSVALKLDGTAVVWGQPRLPITLSNLVTVAAAGTDTIVLTRDGTMAGFGTHPCVGSGASNVVAISASPFLTLGLRSDGTVLTWDCPLGEWGIYTPRDLASVVANAATSATRVDSCGICLE